MSLNTCKISVLICHFRLIFDENRVFEKELHFLENIVLLMRIIRDKYLFRLGRYGT